MAQTYGFTKTRKIKLITDESLRSLMTKTNHQYREVVSFYTHLSDQYPHIIEGDWLGQMENLTHLTKSNPHPKHPLSDLYEKYPSGFRRSAISEAVGMRNSWTTRYRQWQDKKQKNEGKNSFRKLNGKKEITFTDKPPIFEKNLNTWLSYYGTEWKLLDSHHVQLKLFNGKGYVRRKMALEKPITIPSGYATGSPSLIQRGENWYLHIPLILPKKGLKFGTAKERLKKKDARLCLVDLGMNHHAVCTIQDSEGRVHDTLFLLAKKDNHLRKCYLDKIVNKNRQTGVPNKDEVFCSALWSKIRNFNEYIAHKVSRQIVNFAKKNGANTIVFEHLANLGPQKGRRSHRLNQRYLFWVKGRVVKYTQYKSLHEGIMVNRVTPKNTSRRCPYCGSLSIIRYTESTKKKYGVELAHCINCKTHGVNSDFVGSLGIGTNFRIKHA